MNNTYDVFLHGRVMHVNKTEEEVKQIIGSDINVEVFVKNANTYKGWKVERYVPIGGKVSNISRSDKLWAEWDEVRLKLNPKAIVQI